MATVTDDPSVGRFLARDPLGRAPLLGLATQPYVYADNNPLRSTDPTGQLYSNDGYLGGGSGTATPVGTGAPARVTTTHPSRHTTGAMASPAKSVAQSVIASGMGNACTDVSGEPTCDQIASARSIAGSYADAMSEVALALTGIGAGGGIANVLGSASEWLTSLIASAVTKFTAGLLASVITEAVSLHFLFLTQQNTWTPSQWRSRGWFAVWMGLVGLVVAGASALIGVEIAALTDAVFGGPDDVVGDVASLVASTVAVGINAMGFGGSAFGTLFAEQSALS